MPRLISDILPLIGEFTGEKYILPFVFGDFEKYTVGEEVKLRVKYPKKAPNEKEIKYIVKHELISVLIHYKIPLTIKIANSACENTKLRVLKWLENNYYPVNAVTYKNLLDPTGDTTVIIFQRQI